MKLTLSMSAATSDADILRIAKTWMFGSQKTRRAAEAELLSMSIPKAYKFPTGKRLYRQLTLPAKTVENLVNGGTLVHKRLEGLSSWTTSKRFAANFTAGINTGSIVILSSLIPASSILFSYEQFVKNTKLSTAEMAQILGTRLDKFLAWAKAEAEVIVINSDKLPKIKPADLTVISHTAVTATNLKANLLRQLTRAGAKKVTKSYSGPNSAVKKTMKTDYYYIAKTLVLQVDSDRVTFHSAMPAPKVRTFIESMPLTAETLPRILEMAKAGKFKRTRTKAAAPVASVKTTMAKASAEFKSAIATARTALRAKTFVTSVTASSEVTESGENYLGRLTCRTKGSFTEVIIRVQLKDGAVSYGARYFAKSKNPRRPTTIELGYRPDLEVLLRDLKTRLSSIKASQVPGNRSTV